MAASTTTEHIQQPPPPPPEHQSEEAHAHEVASYLSQCLSLLPMSVYLSAEQRQQVLELSGGGKRLRFDPEFADPSAVLAKLAARTESESAAAKVASGKAKKHKKLAAAKQTVKPLSGETAADTNGNQPASHTQNPKAARAEATRQELQARLKARLEQLRAQRHAKAKAAKAEGEGADAAAAVSRSTRLKMKRKELALKRRVQSLGIAKSPLQGSSDQKKPQKQQPSSGVTYNKEGKILYSKFDLVAKEELFGSETTGSRRAAEKTKRRRQKLERRLVPTGSIGVAANVGDRLERLKAGGNPDKAARLADKGRWEKALARAEGIKVKDDPTKLARTAKREAVQRRAKARKWQQREEGVRQRQTEQQERRRSNIKARKDARVKKKIDRAKKKGRILPELHNGK